MKTPLAIATLSRRKPDPDLLPVAAGPDRFDARRARVRLGGEAPRGRRSQPSDPARQRRYTRIDVCAFVTRAGISA